MQHPSFLARAFLVVWLCAACGPSSNREPESSIEEAGSSPPIEDADADRDANGDEPISVVAPNPLQLTEHCAGVRTPCSELADQQACTAQGCTFASCTGRASNCWDATSAGTKLELCRTLTPYCRVVRDSLFLWDVCQSASADTSIPVPCAALQQRSDCVQAACTWSEKPLCQGSLPPACDRLDVTRCAAAAGCRVVQQREAACAGADCACETGAQACAGSCVDTSSSALHCGQCGHACATGELCTQGSCVDIDECSAGSVRCPTHATCVNTPGSYACECAPGFAGTDCQNINECSSADSCDTRATCVDTEGSFQCTCRSGFSGDGKTCSDIDECAAQACGPFADCTNTQGSYSCSSPRPSCSGGSCSCPSGLSVCGARCVNLQDDNANCGSCGNTCGTQLSCRSGSCACSATGQTSCDGQTCVDTRSNRLHCTACGTRCTLCAGACIDVQRVFASGGTSCALMTNKQLYCWGYNTSNGISSTSPTRVELSSGTPLADVQDVHISDARVFAILANGDVYVWGNGIVTNGSAAAGIEVSIATPQRLNLASGQALTNVAEIDSYLTWFAARTGDGFAYAWGYAFQNGWLGNGTEASSTLPVQVLKTPPATPLSGATRLVGHGSNRCVITTDKRVSCWGQSDYAAVVPTLINDPVQGVINKPLENVVALSGSLGHTCALIGDGGVYCWGSAADGRLGNGFNNDNYYLLAFAVELDASTQPLTNVTRIALSPNHSCAIVAGGSVYCWGRGDSGVLGDGSTQTRARAVQVRTATGALTDVVDLSLGHDSSCALQSSGAVQCWGNNASGQLGDGTGTASNVAVRVLFPAGLGTVTALAQGAYHRCANHSGKDVTCWGANAYGQSGGSASMFLRPELVHW